MRKKALSTEKLVSLGTSPIVQSLMRFRTNILEHLGKLGSELAGLLNRKNGFFAFQSALHVFPACQQQGIMDLEKWNAPSLWIDHYDDMALGTVFFAEGIFGDQFGIRGREIVRFEAETGLMEVIASTLEDWSRIILDDYNYQTGYPLAHKWQKLHGLIPYGQRLVAVKPFVLGGNFDVPNLFALDAVKAMRYHGDLAVRIRDVPDGTKITFEIGD